MWVVAVSINAGFLFEQCIRAVAKKEIVIACPYFCYLNSLLVELLNAVSCISQKKKKKCCVLLPNYV